MDDKHRVYLASLYEIYNDVIKPLIATYEAREQVFPTPIFNEIRSFNDHVARCYRKEVSSEFIESQLTKASRHIHRIILDCYKYLIISFDDTVKAFEKKTRNIDLSIINDSKFYVEFSGLRDNAIKAVREAKALESNTNGGDNQAYKGFEEAFNLYSSLDELISLNHSKIQWAKVKSKLKKSFWLLAAIISAILSWLITDFFKSNLIDKVWNWISQ